MNSIRNFFFGFVALLLAITGSAFAADFGPLNIPTYQQATSTPYNWSGIYAGITAGHSWNQETTKWTYGDPQKIDLTGSDFGLAFGANKQFGNFVLGLTADVMKSGQSGAGPTFEWCDEWGYNYALTDSASLDVFGTARLIAGFVPTERLMIYGTAGLAGGLLTHTNTLNVSGPGDKWTQATTTKYAGIGPVFGIGAAWAVTPNMFLTAEALHYDLGQSSVIHSSSSGYAEGRTADNKGVIVKAGLNIKF